MINVEKTYLINETSPINGTKGKARYLFLLMVMGLMFGLWQPSWAGVFSNTIDDGDIVGEPTGIAIVWASNNIDIYHSGELVELTNCPLFPVNFGGAINVLGTRLRQGKYIVCKASKGGISRKANAASRALPAGQKPDHHMSNMLDDHQKFSFSFVMALKVFRIQSI